MVVCIFLMAALAVGFFPPAFAALSRIVQPTIAAWPPLSVRPSASSWAAACSRRAWAIWARRQASALGIIIIGAVIVVGSAATMLLKLLTDLEEGC